MLECSNKNFVLAERSPDKGGIPDIVRQAIRNVM